ncbi:hypothetical protein niasHS_002567 [Heterodera schachtii]|uniref:Uncharacterized protein n=1 Tax=Heterodera schachtii TaxID=97005 RepID=A0ABD2KKC8_HETSC
MTKRAENGGHFIGTKHSGEGKGKGKVEFPTERGDKANDFFAGLRATAHCLLLLLLSIWPPSAHPNIVIKVAHLQPNNPSIINEPQVLEMCYNDMKERAILPREIRLQLFTMGSCNRFSGVEQWGRGIIGKGGQLAKGGGED